MIAKDFFSDLFFRYQAELRIYISRIFCEEVAEDTVQEAFKNLMKKESYDVNGIVNYRAYLYKSAKNIALNNLKRKEYSDKALSALPEAPSAGGCVIDALSAEQSLDIVNDILENIPEKYRMTFVMNRVYGKSYSEIALELGVTVSAVEKRMMKVLMILRDAIA